MARYTPWTVTAICATVTVCTIAALCEVVLCNPRITRLFPADRAW